MSEAPAQPDPPATPPAHTPAPPGRSARFLRFVPLLATLIGGAGISLISYFLAADAQRERMQLEFEREAVPIETIILRRISTNLEVVQSVRALYAASREVDPGEFVEFTRPALATYPGIELLGWAPRVPASGLREHLRAAAMTLGRDDYAVRRPDGSPATAPASPDGDLFPVLYVSPPGQEATLLGIDLAAIDGCSGALDRAAASGLAASTPRVSLKGPAAAPRRFNTLIVVPVYANGRPAATEQDRRDNLAGFAVAAIALADMMRDALAQHDLHGQEIQLAELEPDGLTLGPAIYRSSTAELDGEGRRGRDDLRIQPWRRTVPILDHRWALVGFPTARYEASLTRRRLWVVPVTGLFFTALLGAYLHTLAGRTARVEAVVAQRTAELTRANRQLADQVEERRQAEQALRESEAFYHSLVESIPQNILRKDRDGRFTFANQRFCAIVGKPLDRVVGKTDLDLFPRDLAEKYRHDDQEVMRSGQIFDTVEEHVTPTGEDLYVHVIKIPLLDDQGRAMGITGVFSDVTARVRAERGLQQANARLEEANRQLEEAARSERQARETLQKTQGTLIQAEKLAGLGQMVAGVAHEINNPLAFVSNNVAVLQRDCQALVELLDAYAAADDAVRAGAPEAHARIADLAERIDLPYTRTNITDVLKRSREGLRRIHQIVRDLRDFARLDESDLHEVDLNAGIESTLNIVRGHARKKQVEITFEPSPLPPVACYPAKVNQVIMNLVSNAIDACQQAGRVSVRTAMEDGMVRIEVADTGCGIEPNILDKIFDPFFTTKPPGEGTGLGLSISYGIVQQHGGTIDVESAKGQGTRFTVLLPLRPPKATAAAGGREGTTDERG